MCELFGLSSLTAHNINDYLKEFFSHSTEHPHGWGIADLSGDEIRLSTETLPAYASGRLASLLEEHNRYNNMLAHIRRATVGHVSPENCHPFIREDKSGRQWTLIHNGTIFRGLKLLSYHTKQKGQTDSERLLMYLIDNIDAETEKRGRVLSAFDRFQVVDKVIAELAYKNKLNLIIYDGQQMYVHTNMKDTLYQKRIDDGIIFTTAPSDKDGWEPVPMMTLQVYRDGQLKYRGENHGCEYIADDISRFDYSV